MFRIWLTCSSSRSRSLAFLPARNQPKLLRQGYRARPSLGLCSSITLSVCTHIELLGHWCWFCYGDVATECLLLPITILPFSRLRPCVRHLSAGVMVQAIPNSRCVELLVFLVFVIPLYRTNTMTLLLTVSQLNAGPLWSSSSAACQPIVCQPRCNHLQSRYYNGSFKVDVINRNHSTCR